MLIGLSLIVGVRCSLLSTLSRPVPPPLSDFIRLLGRPLPPPDVPEWLSLGETRSPPPCTDFTSLIVLPDDAELYFVEASGGVFDAVAAGGVTATLGCTCMRPPAVVILIFVGFKTCGVE
ncbi:hypothetical protein NP493_7896g00000 [Ridgeia piscesae]|uniref:Uncharacterized protein n=1 Tax=Ridgeia piscesae TaxID=27915 RepID=A0AAD9IQV7_RIDPI|nr:hypothetical protein NP493_7896g00000 [Ridgeia piscesae]